MSLPTISKAYLKGHLWGILITTFRVTLMGTFRDTSITLGETGRGILH